MELALKTREALLLCGQLGTLAVQDFHQPTHRRAHLLRDALGGTAAQSSTPMALRKCSATT